VTSAVSTPQLSDISSVYRTAQWHQQCLPHSSVTSAVSTAQLSDISSVYRTAQWHQQCLPHSSNCSLRCRSLNVLYIRTEIVITKTLTIAVFWSVKSCLHVRGRRLPFILRTERAESSKLLVITHIGNYWPYTYSVTF